MPAPVAVLQPPGTPACPLETVAGTAAAEGRPVTGRAVRDFVELTKPRVVTMILVTTLVGFYLGSSSTPDWWLLAAALLGTGLSAGGTLALNQYIERDADAQMVRTQD